MGYFKDLELSDNFECPVCESKFTDLVELLGHLDKDSCV